MRALRPDTYVPRSNITGRWQADEGDRQKEVWNRDQDAIFHDLKDKLFDIVAGKHIMTRNTKVKAFHPYVATRPCHTDTGGILIRATFGGFGEEHVMVLRGNTSDHLFRDMAMSLIKTWSGPLACVASMT